jgi:hypothetical protein
MRNLINAMWRGGRRDTLLSKVGEGGKWLHPPGLPRTAGNFSANTIEWFTMAAAFNGTVECSVTVRVTRSLFYIAECRFSGYSTERDEIKHTRMAALCSQRCHLVDEFLT